MKRAFLWAISGIVFLGTSAKADNFDFSFTVVGDDPGTVTGEILGLTNNSTGPASEVILTDYPTDYDSFTPIFGPTPTTIPAADILINTFTETGGTITFADFVAYYAPTANALSEQFEIIINQANLQFSDVITQERFFDSINGDITYSQAPSTSTVPEPPLVSLFSTLLLAVALVAGKRIAHGR